MRLVILESPYAGDTEVNLAYAKRCVLDCLQRNESAFASHLYFTIPGILNDADPVERKLGIRAGLAWGRVADATVVYQDFGISPGMEDGIARALSEGRPIEYRSLFHGSVAA